MDEELNYLDLVVLRKIDADTTVEKFGSQINTSFFEAANLLGGMKIKGLIDIQSAIGGQSPIKITGYGSDIIAEAERKYAEPLDTLDQAILHTLASGVRELSALSSVINIRPKDLALHLYKLKAGDYIEHEVRSARVSFSLTEKGFNLVGVVRAVGPQAKAGAPNAATAAGGTTGARPVNVPAQGVGPASVPASAVIGAANDDEINDILNFGGFRKKDAPGGKLEQKSRMRPDTMAATKQKPDGTKAPADNDMKKIVPPASFSSPPSGLGADGKPDRTAMLYSKVEYYVREYFLYGVLLLVLLAVMAAAAASILGGKPVV